MPAALTVAFLVLAAVFAVAGLSKLADRDGTRAALVGFGVPEHLTGALAIALPVAELVIAGLLLPASTALYGALGAATLLAIFSCAIAWSLARGRSPDCHCFGRLHSAPTDPWTLARTGTLTAVALVVLVAGRDDPGPGAFAWTARLEGVDWLILALGTTIAAVVVVSTIVVTHALRRYGQVLVRLDTAEARLREAGMAIDDLDGVPLLGLEPGTTAPAFWLPSADGDRVALEDLLRPGRPLLLLFTSPTCDPCSVLMPKVARWQREHADGLTIALLSDGDPDAVRAEAAEHGLGHVLVDESLAAYEAFEVNGTPSAVLIADDGTIASWLASGGDSIETLLGQALQGLGRAPGLPIGSELPSVRLESLDGVESELAELVSDETVVLFWNPGCGFCREMRDDLLVWESAAPDEAPTLVVVSAGDTDDVRAEGFSSTVLLDPAWTASSALGADGTPMAVLVDGQGRIASSPVTGSTAVLELMGATAYAAAR